MADLEALKESYDEREADGRRLAERMAEQVGEMLAAEGISLAVPIEYRLKSWQSVAAKVGRKELSIGHVLHLGDLVGLRVILLGSVPRDVLRSINRVSALLETVDLEFERVLDQREEYTRGVDTSQDAQEINVDLLRKVLDEALPARNKSNGDDYERLLKELRERGINTSGALRNLITENLAKAREVEARYVDESRHKLIKQIPVEEGGGEDLNMLIKLEDGEEVVTSHERYKRGVFLSHVGLVREMLTS